MQNGVGRLQGLGELVTQWAAEHCQHCVQSAAGAGHCPVTGRGLVDQHLGVNTLAAQCVVDTVSSAGGTTVDVGVVEC